MNPEMPGQTPEIEHATKPEVWLVDDDDDHSETLIELWQENFPDFNYQHFATAQEALDKIEQATSSDPMSMPDIVFVDGNLGKDKEPWQFGGNFIQEILRISQKKNIPPPVLVAHSNSGKANQRMMVDGMVAAGGEQTIKRIDKMSDPNAHEAYEKLFVDFLEQRKHSENPTQPTP
jgi:CheY-like chemotaxis protein